MYLKQEKHFVQATIYLRRISIGAGASPCGPARLLIYKVPRFFASPKIVPRSTARD